MGSSGTRVVVRGSRAPRLSRLGRGGPRRGAIWDTELEAIDSGLPDTQLVMVGECWQHMLLEIHRVKA